MRSYIIRTKLKNQVTAGSGDNIKKGEDGFMYAYGALEIDFDKRQVHLLDGPGGEPLVTFMFPVGEDVENCFLPGAHVAFPFGTADE